MEKCDRNGKTSGRYRLLNRIGCGEQGEIYLAYDEKLDMKKVIKRIRKEESEYYSLRRQQFISEILLMKELQHPCLPHISDLLIEQDQIMLVMDYVEGVTLQEYIHKHGKQKEAVVIQWGIQLAEFFEYLHSRNPPVIHRDLKPSNIILHSSGRLIVLDFGIAMAGQSRNIWCQGTEGYAAPEQYCSSGICDERTDIYALGRTLLYCLTGQESETFSNHILPFYNKISFNKIFRKTEHMSSHMSRLLARCTCRQKEERFQTMTEVKRELQSLSTQHFTQISTLHITLQSLWQDHKSCCCKIIIGTFCGIILFFIACNLFLSEKNRREATAYVDCAIETRDEKKMISYFDQALQKAPSEEIIYRGILEYYLKPHHFAGDTMGKILNLYEKNQSLSELKNRNPGYYGVYCYETGIGYFYGIGGIAGKQESNLWFSRALEFGMDLSEAQKRRADFYRRISGYYQSFLIEGQDPSGEGQEKSFLEFYHILQELNEDCTDTGKMQSESVEISEADQRVTFYGVMEVAEEIREHCKGFLEEGVKAESLLREVDKTLEFCDLGYDKITQEEEDQLKDRAAAARKRIQIMEGYHE